MYKAMKYWGKKPHNIWNAYIERYCPADGIMLDPFVGSGIAAFESARLGRRCVAFDLNPLSSFFIDVLSSSFDESAFLASFKRIITVVENDSIYQRHYLRGSNKERATVYNYRWYAGRLVGVAFKTAKGKQRLITPDAEDLEKVAEISAIQMAHWCPNDRFPRTPSINHKFIQDLGGDHFRDLWTRRNLYLLALLFHEISKENNKAVRLQLLSGFIQTLHLTYRMVYPRSTKSNRDFSGSWGRADYMIRRKSMEQNPAVVFSRSCTGKQGILAAMKDIHRSFPQGIKVADISKSRNLRKTALINYGAVDVADLDRYVPAKSVDFIITDPPYAGLVRYLDLSLVWLVWLKKLDLRYVPDLRAEITIKDGQLGREEYRRRLTNAFKQMHRVLKDDGKLVVTFHHQEIREWNEFVNAVSLSGFKFDKVTHQYNRRSGESNVANPYGTSGSDFYIRCVKQRDVDFTNDTSGLEHFILQKAIEIIARRNEPTPYNFIFDGLVPELLQAGWSDPTDSRTNVQTILRANAGPGKIFSCTPNTENKAGDIWWFNDPAKHISHPDRPLRDRVEDTILSLLRRKVSVRLDDVIAELFREYPNGLTPDIRAVRPLLEKYAFRSAGRWKIKETAVTKSTEHTQILRAILLIGQRAQQRTYIGKREQPERCRDGTTLRDSACCRDLSNLAVYDRQQLERIEMIDALWLDGADRNPVCAFEVENSTDFTSALQRASNLELTIPKVMVIPDSRERELTSITDPLFKSSFKNQNWKYVCYSAIEKLAGFSKPSLDELLKISRELP